MVGGEEGDAMRQGLQGSGWHRIIVSHRIAATQAGAVRVQQAKWFLKSSFCVVITMAMHWVCARQRADGLGGLATVASANKKGSGPPHLSELGERGGGVSCFSPDRALFRRQFSLTTTMSRFCAGCVPLCLSAGKCEIAIRRTESKWETTRPGHLLKH
jgi:hypothetical protein